jgi:5'-nucleotidase (lipoprotein e(P4) family)
MIRRALAPVLLLSLLAGCRSTAPLPPPAPPQSPPAPVAGAPPSAADPDSIRWVRDAAEYRAAVVQAYRAATALVEAEARARKAGTWAVVLDADETIISNVTYQEERARQGLAYSTESWAAWVRRREATPLPGAAAFLTRVRALGGRIAVVTNRLQSECDDTAAVFGRYQLIYDAMLCRPNGAPSDKNPRFRAVSAGQTPAAKTPVEVVAFVGDNILDFPDLGQSVKEKGEAGLAAFGSRYFVLPNPMYGSWQ